MRQRDAVAHARALAAESRDRRRRIWEEIQRAATECAAAITEVARVFGRLDGVHVKLEDGREWQT